jgi:hypothetical protein
MLTPICISDHRSLDVVDDGVGALGMTMDLVADFRGSHPHHKHHKTRQAPVR